MEPSSSSQPSRGHWNLVSLRVKDLELVNQPECLPQELEVPKYDIGSRCQWVPPTELTDRGTIIGRAFLPFGKTEQGCLSWSWLYLVFLDPDSPSRSWVVAEWAGEDDIEVLQTSNTNSTPSTTWEGSQ
jgi:hypothetical protein